MMKPAEGSAKARMLMAAAGWPAAPIEAVRLACTGLPTAADLRALHAAIQP